MERESSLSSSLLLALTRHGRARIADKNVDGAHLVLDGFQGGGKLKRLDFCGGDGKKVETTGWSGLFPARHARRSLPLISLTFSSSVTSTAFVKTQGSTAPDRRQARPRSSSAADAKRSCDRPTSVTLALAATNARARARPSPADPPVMRIWSPAKVSGRRGRKRGISVGWGRRRENKRKWSEPKALSYFFTPPSVARTLPSAARTPPRPPAMPHPPEPPISEARPLSLLIKGWLR